VTDHDVKITHNAAYERALLGSVLIGLIDPREIPDDSVWTAKHNVLLGRLREARESGVPAEPNALAGWLLDMHHADACGGLGFVGELVGEAASSPDNAAWYAERLAELARRRNLTTCARRMLQASEEGASSEHLAAMASRAAAVTLRPSSAMVTLGGFEDIALAEIELRVDRPHGLLTGLPDLDKHLVGGLRPGMLMSIAAPTSMGKTTLGLNIATHMGLQQDAAGIVFTMEMTTQECYDKILSDVSGVWHEKILTGKLTDTDWTRVAKAAADMSQAQLWLHEGPTTVRKIGAAIDSVRNQGGACDFVVLDYAQLIKSEPGQRYGTRQEEVSAIVRAVRELAIEKHVVIIMMVQCSRAPGGRMDKLPLLSDLRESGEFENSSMVVLMLYSEAYYDPKSPKKGVTEIHVKKNRLGPKDGVVEVAAQLHMSRFASLAADEFHHQAA